MADWKTRNYVPDSDGEDEEDTISTQSYGYQPLEEGPFDDHLGTEPFKERIGEKARENAKQSRTAGEASPPGCTVQQERAIRNPKDSSTIQIDSEDSEDELALPAPCSSSDVRGNLVNQYLNFSSPEAAPGRLRQDEPVGQVSPAPEPIGAIEEHIQVEADNLHSGVTSNPPSPAPSSPLSDLPSTPFLELSQFMSASPENIPKQHRDELSPVVTAIHLAGYHTAHVELPSNISQLPRTHHRERTLRARNPIQLNPYRIEVERYRQSWKARGLKPVRIDPVNDDAASQASGRSSDGALADLEDLDDVEPSGNSTRLDDTVQPISQPPRYSSPPLFEDDELPDIDSIFRAPGAGVVHSGSKRRKTTHFQSASRKHKERSTLSGDPDNVPDRTVGLEVRIPNGRSLPEALPSPPTSPSSHIEPLGGLAKSVAFRYPIGTTPTQIQTPAISSEPRYHRRTVLSDQESSNSSDDEELMLPRVEEQELSSGEESERGTDLLKVRRKIKGVLPASWLRIDQKKQTEKTRHNAPPNAISPSKEIHRGIARPLLKYGRSTSQPPRDGLDAFISLDNSASDDGESAAPKAQPLRHSPPAWVDKSSNITIMNDDSDSMEDNDVDAMLPAGTRNYKIQKVKSRKILRRRRKSVLNSPGVDSLRLKRQTGILDHMIKGAKTKQKVPRKRVQRLGVLDVNSTGRRATQPNFLSIASRTARLRSDKGRHSPSRKHFRLASRNDTLDIQDTVDNWRGNRLLIALHEESVQQLSIYERQPLSQLSGNERVASAAQDQSADLPEIQSPIKDINRYAKKRQRTIDQVLKQMQAAQSTRPARKKNQHSTGKKPNPAGKSFSFIPKAVGKAVPAVLEAPQTGIINLQKSKPRSLQLFKSAASRPKNADMNTLLQERVFERRPPQLVTPIEHERNPECVISHAPTLPSRRKRRPKQLPIIHPLSNYLDEGENDSEKLPALQKQGSDELSGRNLLYGLKPYGAEYTWTFDIEPLPTGLCFCRQTLLGSGIFEEALDLIVLRDLSKPNSCKSVSEDRIMSSWGPWNEVVSAGLDKHSNELLVFLRIFRQKSPGDLGKLVIGLDSIIRYIARDLYFLDSIDRNPFLGSCTTILRNIIDVVQEIPLIYSASSVHDIDSETFPLQILLRVCLLSGQLLQISEHQIVEDVTKAKAQQVFQASIRQTVRWIFANGISDLLPFQQRLSELSNHESVDKRSACKAEAFVIILHLLKRTPEPSMSIWNLLQSTAVCSLTPGMQHVESIERKWFSLFACLPLFDVDSRGTVSQDSRHTLSSDNWPFVEDLLKPVLNAYETKSAKRGSTFNSYCRSLIARCLHLIQSWGWVKCESILRILYDFFAKNNLENLRNEECHGSPRFLEHFTDGIDLAAEKDDRSFALFLKVVSTGLLGMRGVYTDKKIQGIVYRITPNHSRSLPKDEMVRQEDLDALRNHHNLLSVLFVASPASFRPRIGIIRDLICIEESHIQACHINIHVWANLITFQLNAEESLSALEPFVEWYNHFLRQILQQHTMARAEVESHGHSISEDLREATIASNQRQIEAILCDTLDSLRRALEAAKTPQAVCMLFTPTLKDVLCLFDPNNARIDNVVVQALELICDLVRSADNMPPSDDSQGFGNWEVFEEISPGIAESPQLSVPHALYQSLHTLLSNCFGANSTPQEALLTKIVHTWVLVAKFETKHGSKTWNDYVDPYGRDSWFALRRTTQTSMYMPLFLSLLIEGDQSIYEEHKSLLIRSWIVSSVERESQLKFQHLLTNSIFTKDPDHPLLENPPFVLSNSKGRFEITLEEFGARRLSLLSTLFSNLHKHVHFASYHNLPDRFERRQEYADLLKELMRAMRANYISLGSEPDPNSSYVKFVQAIVGYLQQYTSEICPVDKFFLDARNFPLPASDPTYVVGRLKHYALDVRELGTRKKLAIFVQSISERAAIDNQQNYLVGQFHRAMSGEFENGALLSLTLRGVLIRAICPAYTATAFSTAAGWILALPILQAIGKSMDEILLDMDGMNELSVNAILATIKCLFVSMQRSMTLLVHHPGHLELARVLRILTEYYTVLGKSLPALDYCIVLTPAAQEGSRWLGIVRYFRAFATFALVHILDERDAEAPMDEDFEWDYPEDNLDGLRDYALSELKSALTKNWAESNGAYEVRSGNRRQKVDLELDSYEEEQERLMDQIEVFCDALDAYDSFQASAIRRSASKTWGGGN